jgi:hypothetical protein
LISPPDSGGFQPPVLSNPFLDAIFVVPFASPVTLLDRKKNRRMEGGTWLSVPTDRSVFCYERYPCRRNLQRPPMSGSEKCYWCSGYGDQFVVVLRRLTFSHTATRFGKRGNMHFSNVLTSNHGNAATKTTKFRGSHGISAARKQAPLVSLAATPEAPPYQNRSRRRV